MIRLAEYEELAVLSRLMKDLFSSKMQESYSEEGKSSLGLQLELSALQKRFLGKSLFYLYYDNGDIKGVLEIESPRHIAFLFVKEEGRGIAKALCNRAFGNMGEGVSTVGAFGKAIGFYTAMGFEKVSEEKIFHGIPFTLMAKQLKPF